MNKKGFISISVVYSFFLVFLMLLLFIVNSLVTNRVLLNNVKKEIKNEISTDNFARFIINESKDNPQIVNHDNYLPNGAKDNSYRYVGSNPNNYVCFGSDAANCPEDNLYRIIGVFGSKVKLIKKTPVGSKVWDTEDSNTWSLSDMKNYLNGEYLTGLGEYANKIAETTWKVGGNTVTKILKTAGVKNVYDAEIKNPDATNRTDGKTEDKFKVGLMYVSDYMYAADSNQANAWTALMGNNSDSTKDFRAVKDYNWMNLGSYEWTISPDSSRSDYVFLIGYNGLLYHYNATNEYATRPSFYLNASVTYGGGEGTIVKPYRLGA